jgi:hypothetical protein
VATKKAIGNGISIGWIGWPPMLAVERGLGMHEPPVSPFGRTPLLKPSSLPREDDTGHVTLGEPAVRALDEFGIQADAA